MKDWLIQNKNSQIARIWHGVVPEALGDEYYQYLLETGVADYNATEGFCGIQLLRRTENGQTHFLLITFWDSYESIRKFAGEDIEQARYYPKDKEYLLELEPFVKHYHVLKDMG